MTKRVVSQHSASQWIQRILPGNPSRRRGSMLALLGFVGLTSCTTPQGDLVSDTTCSATTALANYGWEVAYFPERFRNEVNRHRFETFASAELLNRNGAQPEGEVIGPDDAGVWWPLLPPRPTADEVDERRDDDFRYNDPPQLQRNVRYVLECEYGKFATTDDEYRRLGRALREGKTVQARYSMGQVLSTTIVESGETLDVTPPSGTESGESGGDGASLPAASTVAVLYVDAAATGEGSGLADQPFATVTEALAAAQPGFIIQLAPGDYGPESGETLPLELAEGVILQGDPQSQGKGITIRGGGDFISPTWARQNVTIVAEDAAQVVGVTLSNPNVRGSAVWVETGSPLILKNRFTDNHREAVFVSGAATPRIESNLIEDNGGNGIAFTRDSGGSATGNSITRSGYGIVVGDRAQPTLEANQIVANRSGLVISGNAQPMVRSNNISESEEDGIVITNDAQPQLESNTLSSNQGFDINHNATGELKLKGRDLAQLNVQTSAAP